MRARRALTAMVAASLFLVPSRATANGGAYFSLDGTHYLPGSTAVATTYVAVPKGKQGLFERGPFYAYVLPGNAQIREGRPIPDGAIRVGMLSVEREQRNQFELRVAFTVPDLAGDFYSIQMCNEPCTISGFREPLYGTISIVTTQREAELLTEQAKLQRRTYGLRREVRKAGKQIEELQGALAQARADNAALAGIVNDLRVTADRAQTTRRPPPTGER